MVFVKNTLGKKLHSCGNGFRGEIIKARGVTFCGFCGKEFRGMKRGAS